MYRNLIVALIFSFLLTGCLQSPFYQREEAIPKNQWQSAYQPSFTFNITDTESAYRIDFLIRHTSMYPYSNIWLLLHVKRPGATTFENMRVNLMLAETSGKWLGRGMGEIWEQRIPINMPMIFDKKGAYEIRMEQNMRLDPLPDILHAGICIEKAGPVRNLKAQQ